MNFKLILGRKTGTIINGRKNEIGVLERVIDEKKRDEYHFVFENGYTLVIRKPVFFFHTLLRSEGDCFFFEFSPGHVFSGIFAYFLFESYGLPLELTVDEMAENNMPVDEEGFRILKELGRLRDKDTFKGRNAFGGELRD